MPKVPEKYTKIVVLAAQLYSQYNCTVRMATKHIVIDGRIRRASTGRPVDRLLEHLQNLPSDFKYSVLLEKDDDWQPKNKKFTPVICKYRQFSFNPLQQLTFARQLYKLKSDLVHFTMTGQQPIFYFGKQITFTHDLTMFKYVRPGRLPKWLHGLRMLGYRLIMWQAHKKAAKILVPTEYVRDAVAKFFRLNSRKLAVTLEASEPPIIGPAEKPEILDDGSEFILYVGSAFPHKNLDRLITSFGLLREHHPNLKLVLAGKREYHSKKLRSWAKSKPYFDDIIFTGFVSEPELKWLYQNAQAYVFPSLSEGFGLPPLEAMAHGCPVVSSNATCLPEVNGEAAHYFDPEDVADMAAKINDVLVNTQLRKKLIEKGHEQTKKYSWRRMAEQTLEVYKEILG